MKSRGLGDETGGPLPALLVRPDPRSPGPGSRHRQVVLNGTEAFFAGPGPSQVTAHGQPGYNRVEAVLVEGQTTRGTWRFDFEGPSVVPASLRAVAGELEVVTPHTIVFRIGGLPGQRMVFSFATSSKERLSSHE